MIRPALFLAIVLLSACSTPKPTWDEIAYAESPTSDDLTRMGSDEARQALYCAAMLRLAGREAEAEALEREGRQRLIDENVATEASAPDFAAAHAAYARIDAETDPYSAAGCAPE
jgi:hypothetical protein